MQNVKGSTSWLHNHEWFVTSIPSPSHDAFAGASMWMVRKCSRCGREEINTESGTNPMNDRSQYWGLTYDEFIARYERCMATLAGLSKAVKK